MEKCYAPISESSHQMNYPDPGKMDPSVANKRNCFWVCRWLRNSTFAYRGKQEKLLNSVKAWWESVGSHIHAHANYMHFPLQFTCFNMRPPHHFYNEMRERREDNILTPNICKSFQKQVKNYRKDICLEHHWKQLYHGLIPSTNLGLTKLG